MKLSACKLGLLAALCATSAAHAAATMTVLHIFNGQDGAYAEGVVFGTDGNLYGTTYIGGLTPPLVGPLPQYYQGPGVLYRLTTSGVFTDLHTFSTVPILSDLGQDAPLGGQNPGPLTVGPGGVFYGYDAEPLGSDHNRWAVFVFSPLLPNLVLPRFLAQGKFFPNGTLVAGSDGSIYGTTNNVRESSYDHDSGTVFKLDVLNQLTTLHTFTGANQGACYPSGLMQAADGDLYGAVTLCGYISAYVWTGFLYKLSPAGVLTTLHVFSGPDGAGPNDTLVQGRDGNIYGTAGGDGTHNDGVAFRISRGDVFTILHEFHSGVDGAGPGGLMQGIDGNFYGTTVTGGALNLGTVFRMTPDGTVTTLYAFTDYSSISYPDSPLVQGSDGSLYGTSCNPACGWRGGVYKIELH